MADEEKPPSPQHKTCGNRSGTLFRDQDMPIYVLPDGLFAVEWAGLWYAKPTLAAIDKFVDEHKASLPFLRLFQAEDDYAVVETVSMNNSGELITRQGKRHRKSWGVWLLEDAKLVAKLKAIDKKRMKLEDQIARLAQDHRDLIEAAGKKVSKHNFDSVLKEHGQQ